MDIAEKDYIAAKALANDTKIGKIYTYYWNKNKTYAVKNAQLVWAYLHKTTHTTNGIKFNSFISNKTFFNKIWKEICS